MQYQLEMEQVFLSVRLFYCATIIDLNNNGTLKLQSPVLVEYSKYDLVCHFLIYHLDVKRIDNIQNYVGKKYYRNYCKQAANSFLIDYNLQKDYSCTPQYLQYVRNV